ncbi:TGS domain-containing protein [Candidatus Palauibacter sp.]|uniref:TGS domain-containing protein n=1 Tax=Candidatus Palauibacter sp. TaxID=3101350 RepID=UPI003B5ACEE9
MSNVGPADSEITLTLPDGSRRTVAAGTPAAEVVRSISEGILRHALAVEVDGEVQDLVTPLRKGGAFRVLTARDEQALAVLMNPSRQRTSRRSRRRCGAFPRKRVPSSARS